MNVLHSSKIIFFHSAAVDMRDLRSISGPPALRVPELLLAVLASLHIDGALGTLANAAIVCLAWKPIALGLLWEQVDDVHVLRILSPLTNEKNYWKWVGFCTRSDALSRVLTGASDVYSNSLKIQQPRRGHASTCWRLG